MDTQRNPKTIFSALMGFPVGLAWQSVRTLICIALAKGFYLWLEESHQIYVARWVSTMIGAAESMLVEAPEWVGWVLAGTTGIIVSIIWWLIAPHIKALIRKNDITSVPYQDSFLLDVDLTPSSGQRPDVRLSIKNNGATGTFSAQCQILAARNDPNQLKTPTSILFFLTNHVSLFMSLIMLIRAAVPPLFSFFGNLNLNFNLFI